MGTAFVLPDFLRPSSTKEVGPSACDRFQGGDTGRRRVFEAPFVSVSFRFFCGGGPPSSVSWCWLLLSRAFSSGRDGGGVSGLS
jgi:hypothetical protein